MDHRVADILIEALPYIRRFSGMTLVIKYGGHAMVDEQLKEDFARDVTLLKFIGMNPVVVHGGGPQINSVMDKMGMQPRFVRGMRLTDEATMDVVEMVLGGKVNKAIVAQMNRQGGKAVGLTGKDGGLLLAKKLHIVYQEDATKPPEILDPGLVGDVTRVNAELIRTLTSRGFIPVIAPVGAGESGETFNINADLVAGKIASALKAERLIFLTDVDGVLDSEGRLISSIDAPSVPRLISQKTVSGGMIPKIEYAMDALKSGVRKVQIINGKRRHALLLELFTDKGVGTEIIAEAEKTAQDGAPRGASKGTPPMNEILDQADRVLAATYKRQPVLFVKGQGYRLWDSEGREYLDFLAGIAVCNLGHAHPAVTEALCGQSKTLVHVSNLYYTQPQAELAARLIEKCFADRVFFCNSGAEANEAAIKLARRHFKVKGEPHRYRIISMERSFHGRTMATLSATGQEKIKDGYAPLLEGFDFVPFNDLDALSKAVGPDTCAVLMEPVQGEGGVRCADPAYLEGARRLCDEAGLLLIFDEIQTGMGRTGRLFAHEHFGVAPDIMTLAKALANGLPMGAMLAGEAVAEAFSPGSHASTFGGTPLVCAAALAVLNVFEKEKIPQRCAATGAYFKKALLGLQKRHASVVEVRGMGLLLGMEIQGEGDPVVTACREKGFLINCVQGNVLRFAPPLIIDTEAIDALIRCLDTLL